jgi:hypothetical protein
LGKMAFFGLHCGHNSYHFGGIEFFEIPTDGMDGYGPTAIKEYLRAAVRPSLWCALFRSPGGPSGFPLPTSFRA